MAKTKDTTMGSKTGFFREILDMIDKYGYFRIFCAGIMLIFVSVTTYVALNPSIYFEQYQKYEEEQHNQSFTKRIEVSPLVESSISETRADVGAMRSFVIEMHNGKYNAAGLSFNYGAMTYEVDDDSIESVREDYDDFTLDRYKLLTKVYNDGYWFGSLEELKKVDKRLALKIESNNAEYLAITMIYGSKQEIGFLGCTFNKDAVINKSEIETKLKKYSSKIGPLLDGNSK